MSCRYVMTGATGFLGGALARALHADGHEVTALGRDADKCRILADEGLLVAACDLAAERNLAARLPDDADAIIHCAALSSTWGPRATFHAANVVATSRLLDAAARRKCRHVVFVSSPSVYFRPRDQLGLRETAPLPLPINAYAWSKGEAERIVRAAPVPTTILRPRGIYGRGDTALLPRLIAACARGPLPLLRGGAAVTDLTHVDDVVDAIRAVLATTPPVRSRTFNVSGGEALAIRRIVGEAADRVATRVRWRRVPWQPFLAAVTAGEALHRLAGSVRGPTITRYSAGILAFSQTLDISAIAAATGWHPRVSFAEGLERTFG